MKPILKTCPFCGNEVKMYFQKYNDNDEYCVDCEEDLDDKYIFPYIRCSHCDIEILSCDSGDTARDLMSIWNERKNGGRPMTEPYKTAVTTFGPRHQAVIAIEELSELQKEICKYLRNDEKYSLEHISEEMADVEIMLAQLRVIFDNDFIIAKYKREKTERIEKLIAERQNK